MAIAFDASSQGTAGNPVTSITWSHTCASGAVLVVQAGSGATNTISGVTYNGVAMTAVDSYTDTTNALKNTSWILLNPASGANNIVVSASLGLILGEGQSYTGASTTANPSTFAHAVGLTAGLPSVSVTNTTGGALVGFGYKSNSATNGVTGGTERQHDAAVTNGGWGDVLGAGSGSQSYEITFSVNGGNFGYAVQAMVLQLPTAGPANVKTFDGVTQSTGIKTYFGLALASTKSVDGIV